MSPDAQCFKCKHLLWVGWSADIKERKGNKTQNIKDGVRVAYTLLSLTHVRIDFISMQVILHSQT